MAHLSNLIVTGASRFLNNIYGNLVGTVNGYTIAKSVPADAVFTDTKPQAAVSAPGAIASAGAVGTSTNYARQDHTHAITVATGDSNGQVKIAGQNASVKGLGAAAYLGTGTASGTVATGNHTHTPSIAAGGTSSLDMSANTAYTLSITGKTFVFKTPANTWRGIQNNLTSDSTTDCLSAAQGKALKAALDGHTHTLNIAADSGTNALSFAFGTKYKLTSGGKDFIFTMPSLGTTATTAAKGNHTHTCTIATDSGENALTLAASTKYKLTAGGSTFIFTTAPDTKYTAANAAPGAIASAGAAGTSTNYARQDHTHAISVATGDSNGQVKVAGQNASVKGLGGSAYLGTTDKPTYNSNTLVKSKGVHARIAYKKVTLSASSWSASTYKDLKTNETFKRQAITTGGDITADTEIVSVQLVGTMEDEYTTTSYTNTFTGDGTTKTFTLDYAPTAITSVTRGGAAVAASGYSVSGRTFTITEAPNSGASLVVNYNVVYSNCTQFSKLKEVVTGASLLEFRAFSTPLVALTVVVGYVSETLDTLSTQATLPTLDSNRYSTV